jgi:hypothetical protein
MNKLQNVQEKETYFSISDEKSQTEKAMKQFI